DDPGGRRARGTLPASEGREEAGGGRGDPWDSPGAAALEERRRGRPRGMAPCPLPAAAPRDASPRLLRPAGHLDDRAAAAGPRFLQLVLGPVSDRAPAADRQLSLDGGGRDHARSPAGFRSGLSRGGAPVPL